VHCLVLVPGNMRVLLTCHVLYSQLMQLNWRGSEVQTGYGELYRMSEHMCAMLYDSLASPYFAEFFGCTNNCYLIVWHII
jgi:hypothetical protein